LIKGKSKERKGKSLTKFEARIRYTKRNKTVETIRITLCFRDLSLGILERTPSGYRYTSNIDNEQAARELLMAYDYTLWGAVGRESKALFPEFEHILRACRREDIVEIAGITERDTMWERLVKLSQLQWGTPNFYVQPDPIP